jgi:predicted nucleotidyltransferase
MDIHRYKEQIVEVCREFDVSTLSVFGSVARGEDGPKSDVDLLVRFKKPVGLTRLIRLEDRFAQIFGRRVDLGTENSLHPLLKCSVQKDSTIIYEG